MARTILWGASCVVILFFATPALPSSDPPDLKRVQDIVNRYGKSCIQHVILEKNNGTITVSANGKTFHFAGIPDPQFITPETILLDLERMGTSPGELQTFLERYGFCKQRVRVAPTFPETASYDPKRLPLTPQQDEEMRRLGLDPNEGWEPVAPPSIPSTVDNPEEQRRRDAAIKAGLDPDRYTVLNPPPPSITEEPGRYIPLGIPPQAQAPLRPTPAPSQHRLDDPPRQTVSSNHDVNPFLRPWGELVPTLVLSFFITWLVGLIPPVLLR
jgi:hypothetical protein